MGRQDQSGRIRAETIWVWVQGKELQLMKPVVYAKGLHLNSLEGKGREAVVFADPRMNLTNALLQTHLNQLPDGFYLDKDVRIAAEGDPDNDDKSYQTLVYEIERDLGVLEPSAQGERQKFLDVMAGARKENINSPDSLVLSKQPSQARKELVGFVNAKISKGIASLSSKKEVAAKRDDFDLLRNAQEYVYHPYFVVTEVHIFSPIGGLQEEDEAELQQLLTFMINRNAELGHQAEVRVVRRPVDPEELAEIALAPLRSLRNPDLFIFKSRKTSGKEETRVAPPVSVNKEGVTQVHMPSWPLRDLNIKSQPVVGPATVEGNVGYAIRVPAPSTDAPAALPDVLVAFAVSLLATVVWDGVKRAWDFLHSEED